MPTSRPAPGAAGARPSPGSGTAGYAPITHARPHADAATARRAPSADSSTAATAEPWSGCGPVPRATPRRLTGPSPGPSASGPQSRVRVRSRVSCPPARSCKAPVGSSPENNSTTAEHRPTDTVSRLIAWCSRIRRQKWPPWVFLDNSHVGRPSREAHASGTPRSTSAAFNENPVALTTIISGGNRNPAKLHRGADS